MTAQTAICGAIQTLSGLDGTNDTIVEAIARTLAIALNQIRRNITSSIYAQHF